eukprot:TRINITY_DN91622_c0_g1_i1.p1 TRINITY_DN91622_c0_g1~~TRINITY_DN91622_c0_g1_i1.p1  ORF type:complete len:954 (+),score=157.69 TRINITY_DN91622_c0_g1_i1:142-3003(+)
MALKSTAVVWSALLLAACHARKATSSEEIEKALLDHNDECTLELGTCTLSALQQRAVQKTASLGHQAEDHDGTSQGTWPAHRGQDNTSWHPEEEFAPHSGHVKGLLSLASRLLERDFAHGGSSRGGSTQALYRNLLLGLVAMALIVVVFEAFFLRSTLFDGLISALARLTATGSREQDKVEKPQAPSEDAAAALSPSQKAKFWELLQTADGKRVVREEETSTDVIGFERRAFSAMESAGHVQVKLLRHGPCTEAVAVKVRTSVEQDVLGSAFAAAPSKGSELNDFDLVERTVTFAAGEAAATVDVPIHLTHTEQSCTRWFLVELMEIVSGHATLGGPTICRWEDETISHHPSARVYILQEDRFPDDFEEEWHDQPFWLVAYYIRSRVKVRGSKYWKVLAALAYTSFHNVVISSLVQKSAIDWACDWQGAGAATYDRILLMGFILFASFLLCRWADAVKVQNAGRTGGTMMQHRSRFVSKLLMLEHNQLFEAAGSRWFYSALENVQVMVTDGYSQTFVIGECLFALALSLFMLLHGKAVSNGIMLILLIIPVSAICQASRRERLAKLLGERMDMEEDWVHTLSWCAHAGSSIYSLGTRELAHLETKFTQDSQLFIKRHQAARDVMNDTLWVSNWLGHFAHVLILIIGGMQLISDRQSQAHTFKVGSFVLLLKLTNEFEKYLAKLNGSILDLQRASVSIQRVRQLLCIVEKQSLRLQTGDCLPNDTTRIEGRIELTDVQYIAPSHFIAGDVLGPLKMISGATCSLPLHRVVCVSGASESTRNTFMALIAKVVPPDEGRVRTPTDMWAVMLPAVPVAIPDVSTMEALHFAGAPMKVATRLSDVLGIPLVGNVNRLPPGQLQTLSIARALLRDPPMLVLDGTLACIQQSRRPRIESLLRAWQHGGLQLILNWLIPGSPAAGETAPPSPRTLVITRADMQAWDVHIELNEILDESIPA